MGQLMSLGVDIDSIPAKGVLLSKDGQVLSKEYLWTEGDPVGAVKRLVGILFEKTPDPISVRTVGTTGSTRRLIGSMLGTDVVKNEVTAHTVGTLSRHPGVRTILEIGGQDSKIILIRDGVVSDHAMGTLRTAGTGAFLSSQAKRLGLKVESLGDLALRSQSPSKIVTGCTVFAKSNMIHKTQTGHNKEDIVVGLCRAAVLNYLNNVGKGKRIKEPIVFQGDVNKNRGVVRASEGELHSGVTVDPESHLMGTIGTAILSHSASRERPFDPSLLEMTFMTKAGECSGCPNHCEIVRFYRGGKLLDTQDNRCEKDLNR